MDGGSVSAQNSPNFVQIMENGKSKIYNYEVIHHAKHRIKKR
ncbi:hypothetical protein C5S29_15065 [ANME-1 cluster archaeon GoMg3.2]|nr:hypothetical protein [ANME-1 cluster archaeon GoMg3.2]